MDEKYPTGPLERALAERLSGLLSQVDIADLLVTAYEIERRNPFFFKSWRARGLELDPGETAASRDFRLVDVARATSAAPTYFEPAAVRAQNGTAYACIDGGVFANNPALCAYAAARRLYPKADSYLIVSLGTGQLERPIPLGRAKDWGLVGWARPLLGVIFDGVSDTVEYQLDQLAPLGPAPALSDFARQRSSGSELRQRRPRRRLARQPGAPRTSRSIHSHLSEAGQRRRSGSAPSAQDTARGARVPAAVAALFAMVRQPRERSATIWNKRSRRVSLHV